jgi:hypothetical protein
MKAYFGTLIFNVKSFSGLYSLGKSGIKISFESFSSNESFLVMKLDAMGILCKLCGL